MGLKYDEKKSQSPLDARHASQSDDDDAQPPDDIWDIERGAKRAYSILTIFANSSFPSSPSLGAATAIEATATAARPRNVAHR